MRTALLHDPPLIGYLATIYFGGARPSESAKLTAADVHEGVIEINPSKAKGRKRRFISINPTLQAWLNHPGAKLGGANLRKRVEWIRASVTDYSCQGPVQPGLVFFKQAWRLPWPHDALRHSFCSYGIPKFGAKDIAEWAGNTERTLYQFYRERVRPGEVEKFWALTPQTIW